MGQLGPHLRPLPCWVQTVGFGAWRCIPAVLLISSVILADSGTTEPWSPHLESGERIPP